MNTSKRRHSPMLLLLIILVAFALRVYRLDAQSLWYDEGVTATLTQQSLSELTAWTARDIQPPLYYYVVAGWGRMVGWSEWSLRFVSAWWGVLIVPLMAQLAHRLVRAPTIALAATVLSALHPLLIYYSQEARMYTMVVTLGIVAGYLFLHAIDSDRINGKVNRAAWIQYVLVATASVYTHYFAFFLLLTFVVVGLVTHRAHRKIVVTIIGAHLVVLLLFTACLLHCLRNSTRTVAIGKVRSKWVKQSKPS